MTVSATVQLYGDIGLYSDYNRTIDFESVEDQEAWFDSQTVALTLDNVAYDKFQNTFACAIDYSTAVTYTYARVANIDSTGKTFYCFVSAVELVDETRCRFVLTVDVLQTYMFQYELGVCAINRQHLDRWSSSSDYPNYIPMDVPSDIGGNVVVYNSSQFIEQYDSSVRHCIVGMVSSYEYADIQTQSIIDQAHCNKIDWYLFPVWPDDPYTDHYGVMSFSGMPLDVNGTEYTTLCVKYPRYSDILDGSFISKMGLNPDECVGIWVVPYIGATFNTNSNHEDYTGTTRTAYRYDSKTPVCDMRLRSTWVSTDGYSNPFGVTYALLQGSDSTGYLFNPYGTSDGKDVYGDGIFAAEGDYMFMAYILSADSSSKPNLSSLTSLTYIGNLSPYVPVKPASETTVAGFSHEPGMFQTPYTTYALVSRNGQPMLELPDYFVLNHELYWEDADPQEDYSVGYGNIPIAVRTYVTAQGVNTMIAVPCAEDAFGSQTGVNDTGILGMATMYGGTSADVTSNEWLSYCLTEKDTDRKLAITRALTSFISGSSRGFKTEPENKPPVGIGPGSLAVGMTQGLMGSIDTVASQLALESKKRNAPDSMLVTGTGCVTIVNSEDYLQIDTLMLNTVDRQKEFYKMYFYGYKVSQVEVPDIRSRHYFNYLSISDGYVTGSLSQDIKNQILEAYKGGITVFHYPACETLEYPVKSSASSYYYENIEEALL